MKDAFESPSISIAAARHSMPPTETINAIQGLRGIAALLVVSDHSMLTFAQATHVGPLAAAHLTYIAETLGRHGVEIFFLISGFIMTVISFDDFAQPKAASAFLWRRIIRIVPLYWLVTAVTVAKIHWLGQMPSLPAVIKSLAFIPYTNEHGLLQPLVRRGWTLNYEMFFYLLFAVALVQKPRRGLAGIILLLLLLSISGEFWAARACATEACAVRTFYLQPIALYFAGGIILGGMRIFLRSRQLLPEIAFDSGLGLALALTGAYVAYIAVAAPSNRGYVIGVAFCVLVTALCALLQDKSGGGRLIMTFIIVGESSYSIYMVHTLFIDPAGRLWFSAFGSSGGLVPFLATMIIGSSLLGLATYRSVEKPMTKALRHGLMGKLHAQRRLAVTAEVVLTPSPK